jgi:hypothetical protein
MKSPVAIFFDPFTLFVGAFALALAGMRVLAIVVAVVSIIQAIILYVYTNKIFSPTLTQDDFFSMVHSAKTYIPVLTYINLVITILSLAVAIWGGLTKGQGLTKIMSLFKSRNSNIKRSNNY